MKTVGATSESSRSPGATADERDGPARTRSPHSPRSPRSIRTLNRVQVVLHVDAEALRADSDSGQSVLAGGVHVSAETSRRLACDASRVIMTHDRSGSVLDVGRRTRTVPVAIRRALEERDLGCRFPGCTNRITDAHHVRHWADGGATCLDNLLLLCRRHHRTVHEVGYRVMRSSTGDFAFTDPRGRTVPDAPPMPTRTRDAGAGRRTSLDSLDSANRSRVATPNAPYERLDLDWAMRTMYRPPWRGRQPERIAIDPDQSLLGVRGLLGVGSHEQDPVP